MIVRKGTAADYPAVAAYWNSLIGKEHSCFRFAPVTDVDKLSDLVEHGYSLYVAHEGETFVGFGMWREEHLLGCPSDSRDVWRQIGRLWAEQNPGKIGVMRYPNIVCNEITWFDEMGLTIERKPEGYKPLKPGEDPANRKVWTFKVTVNLDDVKRAIDNNYMFPTS
jgi:hypothetical protein